jgi:hypothetical protein
MPQVPNLLREHQIRSFREEARRLEALTKNPLTQDRASAVMSLRKVNEQLDTQSPQPFTGGELDTAVKRANTLRGELVTDGMPTQAEMRRKPPGAVGKHMGWESRNKEKVLEWKYLERRINYGSDDPDLTNLERYRPAGGAQEISMDNALIPGKLIFDAKNPGATTVLDDEEIGLVKEAMPELALKLALMDDEQRAEVKVLVNKIFSPEIIEKRGPGRPKKE